MTTDLTPLVVGLVGVAFGGVGSTAMTARIERGKLKHERDIAEADRQRAFRIEALTESQASLLAVYTAAVTSAQKYEVGTLRAPSDISPELIKAHMEAMRWSNRLHDEALRHLCVDVVRACRDLGYMGVRTMTAQQGIAMNEEVARKMNAAQEALGAALRAFYA